MSETSHGEEYHLRRGRSDEDGAWSQPVEVMADDQLSHGAQREYQERQTPERGR